MQLILALAALLCPQDDAPEWGGFRGNNGSGSSAVGGVPDRLDPEESAMWRAEVPSGYSSPAVAGDRLFLTGAAGTELITLCLDRESGEELWRRAIEFDGKRVGANSSAAASPVTDGERVYATFHTAGLVAYDLQGEEAWRYDLGEINIPHGMASSPLLAGDRIVQLVDQDLDAYLVALDKRTGKELWKTARPGVTHGYSTPALYTPAEGPAQVVVSGSFQVRSYSVENGALLWWVEGSAWQTKCVPIIVGDRCYVSAYMPSTTELGLPATKSTWEEELAERDADGDGAIARSEWDGGDMLQQTWFIFDLDGDELFQRADWEFLKSSARASGGLFAIELRDLEREDGTVAKLEGDVTATHVAWTFDDRRSLPDCPSPLVVGDSLYLVADGGILTSVDLATGEVRKKARIGSSDSYYASPVCANGRIVTASLGGQLSVVDASDASGEWEAISTVELDDQIWATPALADGQVFVRVGDVLWCLQTLDD